MNWRSYVETTRSKYITYYANYAEQNTNNYDKLETELVTMMSAAKQAGKLGIYYVVLDMERWLWSSGGKFLDLQGHGREGIELINQAVMVTRLLGDTFLEGRLLGQLGRAWLTLEIENLPAAIKYFDQALRIAREVNDVQGIASHLGCLGQIYVDQRNKQEAVACFQEALMLTLQIENQQLAGRLLGSLGSAELIDDTYEGANKAISYFIRAVAIAHQTGDLQGEASHLGYLGNAHEFLGYNTQLSLHRPLFDSPYSRGSHYPGEETGSVSESMFIKESYYHAAISYYERALAIAREIGANHLQQILQHDLARVRSRVS